jgi:hypothetical protein
MKQLKTVDEFSLSGFANAMHKYIPNRTIQKFECFCKIYYNQDGTVNVTLRLHTNNDTNIYRWTYANRYECKGVSVEAFAKPLVQLMNELESLAYAWEGQSEEQEWVFILGGALCYRPVYDGNTCKQTVEKPIQPPPPKPIHHLDIPVRNISQDEVLDFFADEGDE